MKPEEIKRWLTAEEYEYWEVTHDTKNKIPANESHAKALESLARCRIPMKKHEWKGHSVFGNCCLECGGLQPGFWGNRHNRELEGHKPNCAWAAELDGLPKEGDDDYSQDLPPLDETVRGLPDVTED